MRSSSHRQARSAAERDLGNEARVREEVRAIWTWRPLDELSQDLRFSLRTLFKHRAVAIFAIAWFKAWRALNVLGFAFTFGIGTLWGIDAYEPELFATTEPFLVLFTLLYLAIPVLFAMRVEPPKLRGFVDGTLVFGTPLVAFALQAELVADTEYGLAISAVALALAEELHASPHAFAMTVALGASTAFMTPVSSPVNALVVGPGGYRFGDFVRIGTPLAVMALIVTVLLVPVVYPVQAR